MIGWLSGKVVQAVPDRLILDVGGVGYQVAIPLSTYYEIQKSDADGPVRLFIHTHVREDALALYGFWSERERELFERLIAVSGIGPRLAQVVLSGMAPDELIAALAAGDVARTGAHSRGRQEDRRTDGRRAPRQAAGARRPAPRRARHGGVATTTSSPPWSTSATSRRSPKAPSAARARRPPTPPSTNSCAFRCAACRASKPSQPQAIQASARTPRAAAREIRRAPAEHCLPPTPRPCCRG